MVLFDSPQFIEEIEEENYYFRPGNNSLSMLLENIEPEGQANFFKNFEKLEVIFILNSKLFNVSREKSRNLWGIGVPEDDSSLIYVWFDALINYLTVSKRLGLIDQKVNSDILEVKEPFTMLNVIGKDILKFHSILFPHILNCHGIKNMEH